MAFRRLHRNKRRIPIISLIDLIFILLLFFTVTSVMIRFTEGETKLYLPTPKNEPGEAQLLIQIVNEDQYFWLDYTAIDTLYRYSYLLARPDDPRAQLELITRKTTISRDALYGRLSHLKQELQRKRNQDFFVLIRCPEVLPYVYVLDIVQRLVGLPNLQYGCVVGTLEELEASKNISIENNIIQIDF